MDSLDPIEVEAINTLERNEYYALHKKALKSAVSKFLTAKYEVMIAEGLYDQLPDTMDLILKECDRVKDICKKVEDIKHGDCPWIFVTINLKPERASEEWLNPFALDLEKWTGRCTQIPGAFLYSIEQRSEEDEAVHGLHAHLIMEREKIPFSKIKRAFNTHFFDKWVGNHNAIHFVHIKDPAVKQQKIDYILGQKQKDKMEKVRKDKVIRQKYNIPNFFNRKFDEEISASILKRNDALCEEELSSPSPDDCSSSCPTLIEYYEDA